MSLSETWLGPVAVAHYSTIGRLQGPCLGESAVIGRFRAQERLNPAIAPEVIAAVDRLPRELLGDRDRIPESVEGVF